MDAFEKRFAQYVTPLEDLDPEKRRKREKTIAALDELLRQGKIATPEQLALQDFPIGLDDNFRPFPVQPARRDDQEGLMIRLDINEALRRGDQSALAELDLHDDDELGRGFRANPPKRSPETQARIDRAMAAFDAAVLQSIRVTTLRSGWMTTSTCSRGRLVGMVAETNRAARRTERAG